MELTGDEKMNPALRAEVQGLRTGIMGTAEQIPIPNRFSVTPHPGKPNVYITDNASGRTTTVPLFSYGEVRRALSELFPD